MKKLVLVMFCAMLIVVIIAFNYLLWDRENKVKSIEFLEASNQSNNSIIKTLNRNIEELEEENKQLNNRITGLEEEKQQLQEQLAGLNQEILKLKNTLNHKLAVINNLHQGADLKQAKEPIRKWIEAIDSGEYKIAFELLQQQMSNQGSLVSMDAFAESYSKHIKSIEIKTIEPYISENLEDLKGDIVFKVSLEVKEIGKSEGEGKDPGSESPFKEGLNERYIAMYYDSVNDAWVISHISPVP